MMLSTCRGGPADAALIRRVNEKMDIWSLGVCLFELAAGEGGGVGDSSTAFTCKGRVTCHAGLAYMLLPSCPRYSVNHRSRWAPCSTHLPT